METKTGPDCINAAAKLLPLLPLAQAFLAMTGLQGFEIARPIDATLR